MAFLGSGGQVCPLGAMSEWSVTQTALDLCPFIRKGRAGEVPGSQCMPRHWIHIQHLHRLLGCQSNYPVHSCSDTHHLGPGWVGPEARGRKKTIRLSHGSQTPFPAAPCPTTCLGAILTLSQPCARPHIHITHFTGHTVTTWPLFLWDRGRTTSRTGPKVQDWGSGGTRVALSVSEQNLPIQIGFGFRSSDLR